MTSVLVVDDEYMTRDLLRMMLERAGYTVYEAEDGLDALQQIELNQPDIMVLDAMMPRMDGFATVKAIRGGEEATNLPIIMLSAKAHRSAVEEGLKAGANRYLAKPISHKELVKHIKDVLGK